MPRPELSPLEGARSYAGAFRQRWHDPVVAALSSSASTWLIWSTAMSCSFPRLSADLRCVR